MTHLHEYQQRVVDEYHELNERLEKLRAFLNKPPVSVDPNELGRMMWQEVCMSQYASALRGRIEQFQR